MQLVTARVRGHHLVHNSGWFKVEKTLTILAGESLPARSGVLQTLVKINPLTPDPLLFSEPAFHGHETIHGARKKTRSKTMTIAYGVFTAETELVKKLGAIDPAFYEVKKIELGRRLDDSQWMTFVEIPSSSRWSEIQKDIDLLQQGLSGIVVPREWLQEFRQISQQPGTVRLKENLAKNLARLLNTINWSDSSELHETVNRILVRIGYADRFREACKIVEKEAPVFVFFDTSTVLPSDLSLTTILLASSDFSHDPLYYRLACFLKMLLGNHYEKLCRLSRQAEAEEAKKRLECLNFLAGQKKHIRKMNELMNQKIRAVAGERYGLRIEVISDGIRIVADSDEQRPHLHTSKWLLNLFSTIHATGKEKGQDVILLLADPDNDLPEKKRQALRCLIGNLAQKYQTIYATDPSGITDKDNRDLVRILKPAKNGKGFSVYNRVHAGDLQKATK